MLKGRGSVERADWLEQKGCADFLIFSLVHILLQPPTSSVDVEDSPTLKS